MDGSQPILLVSHDLSDHSWQFLTGEPIRMENALLVALHEVISKDTSVYELADMPPGWQASRKSVHEPWIRSLNPLDDEKSV